MDNHYNYFFSLDSGNVHAAIIVASIPEKSCKLIMKEELIWGYISMFHLYISEIKPRLKEMRGQTHFFFIFKFR